MPAEFVAVAVNVYEVPLVSDEITHDVAGDVTVHVAPPGDAVTVYEVGVPPLLGATTVTVAWPSPATAVGVPGVPGAAGKAAVGVTELLVALALDVPAEFVAVAVNV